MTPLKKYLLMFILEMVLFTGILSLFDWNTLDMTKFYSNCLQGLLFGFFMTFYSYWNDKRRKNKEADQKD